MNKWDERFFRLAAEFSSWSKDPSSKIGAVAVGGKDGRQIISQGYNGFPRGISDSASILRQRELKYAKTCHAEKNLIYNACYNQQSLDGTTIYVWGLPVCSECAKGLIQVGVRKVNIPRSAFKDEKWNEEWVKSADLFNEVGVLWEIHESI